MDGALDCSRLFVGSLYPTLGFRWFRGYHRYCVSDDEFFPFQGDLLCWLLVASPMTQENHVAERITSRFKFKSKALAARLHG